mmetsp:Transcript_21281/g.40505  ORF Transcript_21281/g.40505 Transcript_21281/m.40505 type:complete len:543 (-) Transcript_21281:179-1807(-)
MSDEHGEESPEASNHELAEALSEPKPLPKRSCLDHGAGMMSKKMDEINNLLAAAKLVHAPGKETARSKGPDASTNTRLRELLGQPQPTAESSLCSDRHAVDAHPPGYSSCTKASQDSDSEACGTTIETSPDTSGSDPKTESSTLQSLRSFLGGGAGREGGAQAGVGAGAASKLDEVHHLLHAARLVLGPEAVAEVLPKTNNETNSKLRELLKQGFESEQTCPAGAQSTSATIVDTVQRVKQLINTAPAAPKVPEAKLQEVEGLIKSAQSLFGPEQVVSAAARTDNSTADRLRRILEQQAPNTSDHRGETGSQEQAGTVGELATTVDRVRQMLDQQQSTTSETAESNSTNDKLLQILQRSNQSTSKPSEVAAASTIDAKKARKRAKQKSRKAEKMQQALAPSRLTEAMHSDPKLDTNADSTMVPSLAAAKETFDGITNVLGNQTAPEDPKLYARIKGQLNKQDQGEFVHITSEDIKVEKMTDIYRRMQDLMTDTQAKQAQLLQSVISKREQADPIVTQIASTVVGPTQATDVEGDIDELEELD